MLSQPVKTWNKPIALQTVVPSLLAMLLSETRQIFSHLDIKKINWTKIYLMWCRLSLPSGTWYAQSPVTEMWTVPFLFSECVKNACPSHHPPHKPATLATRTTLMLSKWKFSARKLKMWEGYLPQPKLCYRTLQEVPTKPAYGMLRTYRKCQYPTRHCMGGWWDGKLVPIWVTIPLAKDEFNTEGRFRRGSPWPRCGKLSNHSR